MEVLLNLAWSLVAALMLLLWLTFAPRTGPDRRLQIIALAVLLLILFPVISVTDDLLTVQNPAEADSSLRRDHTDWNPYSGFLAVASLPAPAFGEPSVPRFLLTMDGVLLPTKGAPATQAIQNRPPPLA
jgi:hypothetical protein